MSDFTDSLDEGRYRLTDDVRDRLATSFAAGLDDERVLFATLYGSAVEGEAESSVHDLDVALYVTESALSQVWQTESDLGAVLEQRAREIMGEAVPVDVRVYNEAPIHAQFRALTGRLLVIRDRDAFVRVVEYIVPRHLDMEPLRRQALHDLISARQAS
ncbi:MAG: hypothetical protein M5U22_07985 [Thermoleophilia bacterium]|nr:hypothetical protein [Thermoleophilia bacterium]